MLRRPSPWLALSLALAACPEEPPPVAPAEVLDASADAEVVSLQDTTRPDAVLPDPGNPDGSTPPDAAADVPVGGCGDTTFTGCCTGTTLTWCEDDAIFTYDCAGDGLACGWIDGVGYDCSDAALGDPTGEFPFTCSGDTCSDTCTLRACGTACGEFCGSCEAGETCTAAGQCEPCSCEGKTCGDDGCGNSCGTCGSGLTCSGGECVTCSCLGIECGTNACGTFCGSCENGESCQAGICVGSCEAVQEIQGCCDGLWLRWCDADGFQAKLCKTSCGWDGDNGWHECGFEGEDPSGTYTFACPDAPPPPPDPDPVPEPVEAVEVVDVAVPDADAQPETVDTAPDDSASDSTGPDALPDTGADASVPCGDTPPEGCCTPAGLLYWCSGGQLEVVDCVGELGWTGCGWDTDISEYNCSDSQTASGSPALPWLCPDTTCDNACDGKQCGFECGVSCGSCGANQTCNAQGMCE